MIAIAAATALGLPVPAPAQGEPEGYTVKAVNVGSFDVAQYPVTLALDKLPERYRTDRLVVVESKNGRPVPSQVDQLNGSGAPDELTFLAAIHKENATTYTIKKQSPPSSPSDNEMTVRGSRIFQNRHLTIKARKEGSGISVDDRRTGQSLVDQWGLRRAEVKYQDAAVIANGPVRTVFEQRYTIKNSPLGLTERYILYAGQRRLDHRLIFTNPTQKDQFLPGWATEAKQVLKGRQGPLLTKQWPQVEILSVNFYESSRSNLLWVNPSTGHGMGLTLHTPYCDWYGPIRWITPVYKSFSGRVTHARPRHKWVVPEAKPAEYDGRRHRNQHGTIGPVGRFADIAPDRKNATYKSRWFHNSGVPFEVAPNSQHTIDLSLTFYHNNDAPAQMIRELERDANGVAGTVHLYHAETSEQPPLQVAKAPEHFSDDFEGATDRWLKHGQAKIRFNNGQARLTAKSPEGGMRTYVTRDFLNPGEIRGRVASLNNGTKLRVSLKHPTSGELYQIGEVTTTGAFRFPLKEKVPFNDSRSCELRITLHNASDDPKPLQASLDRFTFAWITPPAPELVTPLKDMDLTDLAMSVSILSRTPQRADRGYEVQVADNPSFSDAVMNERFSLKMRVSGATHNDRTFLPDRLLDKGQYYCRVRALGVTGHPGEWTSVRRFRIDNTNHNTKPRTRTINPEKPAFLIPANLPHRFREMLNAMPDVVSRRMVALVAYEDLINSPDRLQAWIEADVPIIFRFYGHTAGNVSYAEHLFRKYDNIIGFTFGESGFPGKSMKRGLKLAAKYGRLAGNYGGFKQIGMGSEQDFYDLLKTHGKYIMGLPKGQHPGFIGERYSPITGLWLIDRVDFWACETEYWVPHHLGIHNRDQHAVDWMAPFLFGLSTGSSAWRVETFIGYKKMYGWAPARHERLDYLKPGFGPLWTHAMGPFFEDIVKHDMIPEQKAVKRKIDTAMLSRPSYLTNKPFAFPEAKVKAAHGEPDHNRQWIPEKNRGYLVPMLPPLATKAEKSRFKHTVMPDTFKSVEHANTYFAKHNAPDASEAYSVLVGDTVIITNTHPEEHPDDNVAAEAYTQGFTKGPVAAIKGKVGYHQYVIGKQKPEELFLHANNYPDKATTLTLQPRNDRDLTIRVKPGFALVFKKEAGRAMKVRIRHNEGPVRIFVQ